ncbi:hypothetical protein J3F83DRAFT_746638 [Trichoderma novae-zelandiae]
MLEPAASNSATQHGATVSSVKEPSLTGPLSKLPPEILLLIASQLSSSPGSLVTIYLTCKALSSFLDTVALFGSI